MKSVSDNKYLQRTLTSVAIVSNAINKGVDSHSFCLLLSRLGYKVIRLELNEDITSFTLIESSFYKYIQINPATPWLRVFRSDSEYKSQELDLSDQSAIRKILINNFPAVIISLGDRAKEITKQNICFASFLPLLETNKSFSIQTRHCFFSRQDLVDAGKEFSSRFATKFEIDKQYGLDDFQNILISFFEDYLPSIRLANRSGAVGDTAQHIGKFMSIHLPGFSAGQPYESAKALSQAGFPSVSASLAEIQSSKYGYSANIECNLPHLVKQLDNPFKQAKHFLGFLKRNRWIYKSKILHFHARSLIYSKNIGGDLCLADLLYFRLIGKDIYIHFRGSEARRKTIFDMHNPFSWFPILAAHATSSLECPDLVKQVPYLFDTQEQIIFWNRAEQLSNAVLVTDPEIQSYIPNSTIMPRIVAKSLFDSPTSLSHATNGSNELFIIAHAPSRPFIKGTKYILDAIQRLRSEGFNVDIDLIQGVPNSEVIRRLTLSDLVVDQLIIGWYGVLSVEAMALGKPVICYLRKDLVQTLDEDNPIINANPETIYEVLEEVLTNKGRLHKVASLSRKYAKKYHHPDSVAAMLKQFYLLNNNSAGRRGHPVLTNVPEKIFQFTELVFGQSYLSQQVSTRDIFSLAIRAESSGHLSLAILYYEFLRTRCSLPSFISISFLDSRIQVLMSRIRGSAYSKENPHGF